jgi:hypothetical protein
MLSSKLLATNYDTILRVAEDGMRKFHKIENLLKNLVLESILDRLEQHFSVFEDS